MLEARGLSVRFRRGIGRREIRALDGIDLEVGQGEFFALLGANGAGKSTAMYCFLGLLRPSAGSVRLMGRAPERGATIFGDVAYLPEEPNYHLYLTVEEAVRYYSALYGRRIPSVRVRETLDRLGLGEFRDLRLAKCSKGMKQKVGIAQCLVGEPKLLFMDEPMRGLDPVIVKEFREILIGLHRAGTTIVMNSHMLAEVEAVATRVAILAHGKLVLSDTLDHLLAAAEREYDVEVEAPETEAMPDFVSSVTSSNGIAHGRFEAARFHEFMALARDRGWPVRSCAVRQSTLEDSFLAAVRGPMPAPPA